MTKFRPEWTDLSDDEFPDDVLEELKEFVRSTARKTKDERIEEVLVEHVDCECCNNKTSSFLPAELLVEEHTSKNDLDITTGNQNSEEDQSYSNRNYNSDETEETIVQGSSQKHAIILLLSSSSDEEDKVQENVGGGQTTESSQLSLANDFQNLQLSHSDEESKLSVDQSKESSSDSSSIGWINGIPFRDPNQVTNLMSTSEDDDKKSNRGTSMTKKPTVGKKKRIIFSDDSSWSEKESSEASQKGNSRQVQQSPRPRSLPKRTIYDLETSSSEEEFEASGKYDDALDSNSYNNDQLSSDGDIDDDSDDDSFIENDAVLDDISVERPKLDRGFKKRREILAQQYFQEFDKKVFHGKLSDHTTVKWSSKLRTTAGHTKLRTIRAEGQAARCSSMIELSTKVLDSDTRLRSTLLHECCHAAAFLMDGITKPPHGKCFQKWANRSMARFPDIIVTTTHSYEIQFRYAWACETPKCGAVFKRHSRSIDPSKQVCGRCKGKLVEVDSKSVNSGGDFIPKKRAPLSEYNTFVRNETASARRDLQRANEQRGIPDKVSQSEVMKELARRWKESKSSSTARMEANSS